MFFDAPSDTTSLGVVVAMDVTLDAAVPVACKENISILTKEQVGKFFFFFFLEVDMFWLSNQSNLISNLISHHIYTLWLSNERNICRATEL